jgi:hypothetical protein
VYDQKILGVNSPLAKHSKQSINQSINLQFFVATAAALIGDGGKPGRCR